MLRSVARTLLVAAAASLLFFGGHIPVQAATFGDYEYRLDGENAILTRYNGEGGSVVVPASLDGHPVVTVAVGAFHRCADVTEVSLPDTVVEIQFAAFEGCTSLRKITLPDSILRIETDAFKNCSALEALSLPPRITRLEHGLLSGCNRLANLALPKELVTIEMYALQDCESLQSIRIPESVTLIGYGAFNRCHALTTVVIPSSVAILREAAFNDCRSIESVEILGDTAYIESRAFADCPKLSDVRFFGIFPTMGEEVFRGAAASLRIGYRTSNWRYGGTIWYDLPIYTFTPPVFAVTFDPQGGTAVEPVDVERTESIPAPGTPPTREGFRFEGWFADPEGTAIVDFPFRPEADTTLYAAWTPLPTPSPTSGPEPTESADATPAASGTPAPAADWVGFLLQHSTPLWLALLTVLAGISLFLVVVLVARGGPPRTR